MSGQIPTCEFTGNRCVKYTCENCSIYAINCLQRNITEATENVVEEVYDKYYDTAGTFHWKGVQTGEHYVNL